jgi:hypothetical protein
MLKIELEIEKTHPWPFSKKFVSQNFQEMGGALLRLVSIAKKRIKKE